jgi:hypothetical protein
LARVGYTMSMDIFEIYFAFLQGCAEHNQHESPEEGWEWNHTLPRCLFGDQPVGQWLTLEQHTVASILQSEAFNHSCVWGGMKTSCPPQWLPLFEKWASVHGRRVALHENTERARLRESYTDERLKQKQEWGKTSHTPESRRDAGRRGGSAGKGNPGRRVNNGKATNAQRWRCLVTGRVLPPGPLTMFQKSQKVDTSMRERVS